MSTADRLAVALDVGGTVMKGAIVSGTGEILYQTDEPTHAEAGPQDVVRRAIEHIERLHVAAERQGLTIAATGLVVPGRVDEERGVAVDSSNLGWTDIPLRKLAELKLGLHVVVGQDVRAGGLAEAVLGAGEGSENSFFLPVGTGIGGAIILAGWPYTGSTYGAGEVGHLRVRGGLDRCACGKTGCAETVASASAVAKRFRAATGQQEATAEDVAAALRAGDRAAAAVWNDAVQALAEVIAVVVTVLDPDVVVVGGGLSRAGDLLLQPLGEALAERLTFENMPRITAARFGDRAGSIGAALLALGTHSRKMETQ
jgi:glucokinase